MDIRNNGIAAQHSATARENMVHKGRRGRTVSKINDCNSRNACQTARQLLDSGLSLLFFRQRVALAVGFISWQRAESLNVERVPFQAEKRNLRVAKKLVGDAAGRDSVLMWCANEQEEKGEGKKSERVHQRGCITAEKLDGKSE